ncbi:major facilitator superfamily MFS_1 [Desulfofarcimen acetoxidans DSM 771]|uniref:Major facilitator superfamily MFS_1 n=1 Tax=Desulfofarcimen acetoxidans (strain ATCC 49208 / DSM 771 / KCTC 5769 / VKM B-1644 / 5575) TaxID=485916 RepID=C8VX25_DESAS|nr:OFA family MFS transporter [Desulfofarcimen acetoxidans]ACV62601.1 major facilitator superfamily MFS_1 [Desulfofarcimen acetoxidans DSM 771]
MSASNSKGWTVTGAAICINLALGVLYAWSIFKKDLSTHYGLSNTEAALPYTIACGIFALMMVPAGRWQDKIGPRVVAATGGALTGLGLILASFFIPTLSDGNTVISSTGFWGITIGFGVLAGTGIGLGYASTTPPAVKWFPPAKKGLITGLVVSGFGLASVYISPLSKYLLTEFALKNAFLILGIGFLFVTVSFAQFLKNPPPGYLPGGTPSPGCKNSDNAKIDYMPGEMLKTPQFFLLWLMFALAASAGLMTIGHIASIAKQQVPSVDLGFLLVAILAIFNAGGRIIAGILSDKIGRTRTMLLVFVFQAAIMFLFSAFKTPALLIMGTAAVGFNYGSLLSLFPSTTADYFGTKNLGANYGLVFTAWGVGGVFGPMLAGMIADAFKVYTLAFQISAGLLILAALISLIVNAPKTIPLTDDIKLKA